MTVSTRVSKDSKSIVAEGSLSINNVIKFLKTQGDVKSISNPKILTLNNQPALISVGNELFYKTQSTTSTSGQLEQVHRGVMRRLTQYLLGILLDFYFPGREFLGRNWGVIKTGFKGLNFPILIIRELLLKIGWITGI